MVPETEPEVYLSSPPDNATADLIGKTCTIQTFNLDDDPENSGQILPETLEKYIGIIEAFVFLKNQFIVKLHGCDAMAFKYDEHVVEIFPLTAFNQYMRTPEGGSQ